MDTNQSHPARSLAAFRESRGSGSDRELPIVSRSVRIGQGTKNDLVLEDDTVSREHALLEQVDSVWRLTDLSSKNGTFVDGVRIPADIPTELSDGAAVAFGAMRLTFSAGGAALPEARAPEPAAAEPGPMRGAGFRLPVWVLLLIIILLAIAALVLLTGGDPGTVETIAEPASALLTRPATPLAA